jgi:hypothetical protein
VSGFVMPVVPILAGLRWVLGHTGDASSLCFEKPLRFTTSSCTPGHRRDGPPTPGLDG